MSPPHRIDRRCEAVPMVVTVRVARSPRERVRACGVRASCYGGASDNCYGKNSGYYPLRAMHAIRHRPALPRAPTTPARASQPAKRGHQAMQNRGLQVRGWMKTCWTVQSESAPTCCTRPMSQRVRTSDAGSGTLVPVDHQRANAGKSRRRPLLIPAPRSIERRRAADGGPRPVRSMGHPAPGPHGGPACPPP